jgi:hypothetical protein
MGNEAGKSEVLKDAHLSIAQYQSSFAPSMPPFQAPIIQEVTINGSAQIFLLLGLIGEIRVYMTFSWISL